MIFAVDKIDCEAENCHIHGRWAIQKVKTTIITAE